MDPLDLAEGARSRSTSRSQRPSLLTGTARPSSASIQAFMDLGPAGQLLSALNSAFPTVDMRAVEATAHEIEKYRQVERLDAFASAVRGMARELDYTQSLQKARQVDESLGAFQREAVFYSRDNQKKSAQMIKPCLRRESKDDGGGVVCLQGQGERLVDRLGTLLPEEDRWDIMNKANRVSSKEDVKELTEHLARLLRQKSDEESRHIRDDVNNALGFFIAQIKSDAEEYQNVFQFVEAMRKMIDDMMLGYSDEGTSNIYRLSQKILADINKNEDRLDDKVINNITIMLNDVKQVKSKFPDRTVKKMVDFEKKANLLLHPDEDIDKHFRSVSFQEKNNR